tara:strand:+ start:5640 stop:7874 length:2235 start_codon:yes stop_codon:yes gene_type:complete
MASSKDVIKSFTIKVNTENGKIKIEGVTQAYENQEVAFKKLQGTVEVGTTNMARSYDKMRDATGSASASTLEMGRVISDSNYGIRGVANNLSQLGSNLASTYKKAGSLTGAFMAMKGALMGPLGALLLFQTGIALLERWSMKSTKAADSVHYLSEASGSAGANLKIFMSRVEDGTITNDDYAASVIKMQEEYTDLNIAVDENGIITDESTDAINRKINAMERLARTAAIERKFVTENAKEIDIETDMQTEKRRLIDEGYEHQVDNIKRLMKEEDIAQAEFYVRENDRIQYYMDAGKEFTARSFRGTGNISSELRGYIKLMKDLGEQQEKTKDVTNLIERVEDVFGKPRTKRTRKATQREAKIFKQQLLDLDKMILTHNKQAEAVGIENEIEKLEIKQKYINLELDAKHELFVQKQILRHKNYLDSIKGLKNEAKMTEDANNKHEMTMREAEREVGEARLAIKENYNLKLIAKEKEVQLTLAEIIADDVINLVSGFDSDGDDALFEWQKARLKRANELKEDQLVGALDNAVEGGNEEDILNASIELRDHQMAVQADEISNDEAHYIRKQEIIQEYLDFAKGIGSFLSAIGKENSAVAKAGLIISKGAASADVVINANKQMIAHSTAHAARVASAGGNPAVAAASAAKMTVEKVKTGIGAGIAVANIWATGVNKKNQVKGGGGSGGGQGGRTFDFNLVGSTQENQAAQVTANALGQPVQAYVVSSAISSQQELDNSILGQASFGDD